MAKLFAWLGVATLALIVCATPAHAGDPLKPYVVFAFDTSGSMLTATGSGPPSCGGTDTRLDHARCAISNIADSYGDMVFALARFRTTVSGTTTAGTFPAGCCAAGPDVPAGGGCAAGPVCNSTSDMFEVLTGLVDGANQASQTWVNFTGNTCTATGTDPEVWRATGNTPLEGTLRGAKQYWLGAQDDNVAMPNFPVWPSGNAGFDPIRNDPTRLSFLPTGCNPSPTCTMNCCAEQCRPYIVIMMTDGAETCGGTPANGASALLTTDVGVCSISGTPCTVPANCTGGGNTCVFRRYRVETKPIAFGIAAPNAQIEGIAQAGGAPNGPGNEGFYANDEAGLQLAISNILDDAIKTELCNNLDDDCDVLVDEDFEPAKGEACNNNLLGKCRVNGTNVCRADGTGLVCNAGQTTVPPGQCTMAGNACNVVNSSGATVAGTCVANGPILVCEPTPAASEVPFGCNAIDDDCDGKIDEGVTGCSCAPQGEACDGDDDDCDGTIDEGITIPCGTGTCQGTQTCVVNGTGTFGPCTAQQPMPEQCNGLDDNCDGVCDGFTRDCSTCTVGQCPTTGGSFPGDDPRNNPGHPSNNPIPQNICHSGTKNCPTLCSMSGNSFGSCLSEQKPLTEVCNNLDDDCDNIIDEGTGGANCSSNCGVGTIVCTNGMLECDAMPTPNDDTCNNIDDDCDNMVDESWVCTTPPNCPCTAAGICNGVQDCVNGNVVCNGTPVMQESCNCDDDDCDLLVDEGNLCPPGASCVDCQCAFKCSDSEFPCPMGKYCKDFNACPNGPNCVCIADPCFGVTCPDDAMGNKQVCKPNGNAPQCLSACDPQVIMCGANEVCIGSTGECKPDNCETFPMKCNATQTCVNGMCVGNPCANVMCPSGEYCVAGQCYGSCADVECPDGQRCVMGICETDPCGQPCPFGKFCDETTNECKTDPCGSIPCPQGQECDPRTGGQCVDSPCAGTMCPDPMNEVCKLGTCYDKNDLLPDAGVEQHVTTGGGGGCSTGNSTGAFAVLAMLLLFARRRRLRAKGARS